ncbi:sugar transferase [Patescibacteria group bacterium]|nr:sugar transferase [Patescibacteria group bacterium]MBU1075145.1 sugar transferase [Patescibacteria group bacterium]MBU1951368.1 sugar transferase [Patescibacteria group bacterium]
MALFHNLFKYIFDLFIALILLVPVVFFSMVIGIVIKLESHGPVFFKQKRFGKHNKPFVMYKFRTMVKDAEKQRGSLEQKNEAEGFLFKLTEDPRETKFGRKLRNIGLDEVPQIFNVLKGEMSFVGPRPLPVNDVNFEKLRANPNQYRQWEIRELAKPGITGLWQVNPGEHSFEEMLDMDEKYVTEYSLISDLNIFLKTVMMALRGVFPGLFARAGKKKLIEDKNI